MPSILDASSPPLFTTAGFESASRSVMATATASAHRSAAVSSDASGVSSIFRPRWTTRCIAALPLDAMSTLSPLGAIRVPILLSWMSIPVPL